MGEIVLELNNVVKTFSGVHALDGVKFQLEKGEIHALMGENGAGKSTFIKVITGVHQPDSGEIILNGKHVVMENTKESTKLGIAAIYQHVTAFPDLTVAENIFLGSEIKNKFGFYNWKEMNQKAEELIRPLSNTINVRSVMSELSVAEQQLVEIAKALSRNAKILIMDEPTASLTHGECEELYGITEKLRDEGVSIIFITHRFEDMYRLASRVTVFRDASYVGTWKVDEITTHDLISAMVGRELNQMYPPKNRKPGKTVLEVRNASKLGFYKDISFEVREGEVLALTGLVGAGRTEVCQMLVGILRPDSGQILVDGKETVITTPRDAFNQGIGLLPEDRQREGLVNELPIFQNVTAATTSKYAVWHSMRTKEEMKESIDLCSRVWLKAKDINAAPTSLSGGNQQKVVFAKLLDCDLKVLILDEPTKGIDIGAKYSIYEIMNELTEKGYAIIMVSSEMPEVLGVSDRILVMKSGRITARFETEKATQEHIMEAAISNVSTAAEGVR